MDTLLSTTQSKYNVTKPLWPGDIGHNIAIYPKSEKPDFNDGMYQMLALNAEAQASASSRFHGMTPKAMLYGSMSSGWAELSIARQYKERIMEHSLQMIYPNPERPDEPHLTLRQPDGVLSKELMSADVFARNNMRNIAAASYYERQNPGMRVLAPGAEEKRIRSITDIHSITGGIGYTNPVFEIHYWLPKCLLDAEKGILWGDHGLSLNATPEKNIGHALEFGLIYPLAARHGRGFEFTDLDGTLVDIADQIWEDVRSLMVPVHYGFRNENQAAMVLAEFMYYRDFKRALDGDSEALSYIDPKLAHPSIRAHFDQTSEVEMMETLERIALPWIKENCNWPTLYEILERDYGQHLADFWQEEIVNTKHPAPTLQDQQIIMAYLPRGGFTNRDIERDFAQKVEKKRVTVPVRWEQAIASHTPRSIGSFDEPFDRKRDPLIFNDRNFVRLGNVSNPDEQDWDRNQMTFEQVAVRDMVFAMAARPQDGAPKTLLYVDDPYNGLLGAAFMKKNGIQEPGEAKAKINPATRGADTFAVDVGSDSAAFTTNRIWELAKDQEYADWRAAKGYGNIVPLSDFSAVGSSWEGYREAMGAFAYKGIAAEGEKKISSAGLETAMRRSIDMGYIQGLSITPGPISGTTAALMTEGMLATLGLTHPPFSGGKYEFDVFMDDDYLPQDGQAREPRYMDFLDQYIHIGIQAKHMLEQRRPPKDPALVLAMMRFNEVYEMLSDPERLNMRETFDPDTRDLTMEPIINIHELVSTNPQFIGSHLEDFFHLPDFVADEEHLIGERKLYDGYAGSQEVQAFLTPEAKKSAEYYEYYLSDPQRKAELAQMLWFTMSAKEMVFKDKKGEPFIAAETGMLWTVGIAQIDQFHYRDLHRAEKAGQAWDTMKNRLRTNIFDPGVIKIDREGVLEP